MLKPEANTKRGLEHVKEIHGHAHMTAQYGGHGFSVGDKEQSVRTKQNQAGDGQEPDGGSDIPVEGPANYGRIAF